MLNDLDTSFNLSKQKTQLFLSLWLFSSFVLLVLFVLSILSFSTFIDMLNTTFTEKYQSNLRNYLKFWHNNAGDIHPPWMVHLYFADLLNYYFLNCSI
jgi:hypothetical protein